MSVFSEVKLAPPNNILGVAQEYRNDPHQDKIDLTIGAYRDDNGEPKVLNVVREAEKVIMEQNYNHEYLSQDGLPEFLTCAQQLMFGFNSRILSEGRVATIQAISGTGAVRLAAEFLSRFFRDRTCYIPSVTWSNHPAILDMANVPKGEYRYLNEDESALDFEGMLNDLNNLPSQSIILLHACAHNPSGFDPTESQWRAIAEVMKKKNHLPFFDNAYQGFVTGCSDTDAFAVRLFAEEGFEMLVACSFSKNFGLYGQRVGCLHIVTANNDVIPNVMSQLRLISRPLYSTCPSYGARIVATILSDPQLNEDWRQQCKEMADRIQGIRTILYDSLLSERVRGNWDKILLQKGMFSFTGLTVDHVNQLKQNHHIYMLGNGRISLSGLNQSNIGRFVQALVQVLGRYEQS